MPDIPNCASSAPAAPDLTHTPQAHSSESDTGAAHEPTDAAPRRSAIRGFRLGRVHVRHLRTFAEHGWAYSEGDGREAAVVFGLFRCYEHGVFQGWRLTVGRHTVWLLV